MEEEPSQQHTKGWRIFLHPRYIPARGVLGIVSFFGFFVNYMLRVNMNIAIVAMTHSEEGSAAALQRSGNVSECIVVPEELQRNITLANSTVSTAEFSWDAREQALVLGSFYWSYILSPVPGGMLAERYGSKVVLGGANLVHGVMALATPLAARTHIGTLIAVRLIQGLASGMTWPAMHVMASRWIPKHERSKFVATYMGNSVGTAVTFPLCGLLMAALGSWVWAFYVPAVLCLAWSVAWALLAFDSPAQHPRISQSELLYLQENVTAFLAKGKPRVPWKDVALSMPFWALLVANCGGVWAFIIIITYAPTYLKIIHGYGIRANGLLSGLPNLNRFLVALLFSWFVDWMLKNKKCSVTFARKLATFISLVIPAGLFLLMGRLGCNGAAEVALLTMIAGIGGCASSGSIVNSVDIAPNFSGTILGLVSVASMSSGFIVPLVVGTIIQDDDAQERWRMVFLSACIINVVTALFYLEFASGEVQPWNEPKRRGEGREGGEMDILQGDEPNGREEGEMDILQENEPKEQREVREVNTLQGDEPKGREEGEMDTLQRDGEEEKCTPHRDA